MTSRTSFPTDPTDTPPALLSAQRFDPGARPRLAYLDGLRGVAALTVAVSHFFYAFAPQYSVGLSGPRTNFALPPAELLWNGRFSVVFFFVLSGFAIAAAAARNQLPLWFTLVLRYIRLAIPVTVSILFSWTLLHCFSGVAARLLQQTHNIWLALGYTSEIPSFNYALRTGLYKALWRGTLFNNPLWSMRTELIGSASLYCLYKLPERLRLALLFLLLFLTPFSSQILYEGFWSGALLREFWVRRGMPIRHAPAWFAVGCLLASYTRNLRSELLLLGFAGGLRRSEIVGLDCAPGRPGESASWVEILPGGLLLRIRGKTGWR
ncbi:MAG: acyltransferase, partial [Rhodospirillales bacterium]|nr:acyltransferase [Acetobacter sp.]